ncbi:MAG: dockerin type I repeat-containing protein [Firmicutes bacterium]|nr:dockerin type I repeat-containing protein [Bacillota bacterium]
MDIARFSDISAGANISDNPAVVESISYDEQGSAVVSCTFAKKGDVNKDTYVNDKDAKIILSYAGGLSDLTAEQKNIADVNGDGEIDLIDAMAVL